MVLTLYTYHQYQHSPYSYLYNSFAAHSSIVITLYMKGPSGCGQTQLARQFGEEFVQNNVPGECLQICCVSLLRFKRKVPSQY